MTTSNDIQPPMVWAGAGPIGIEGPHDDGALPPVVGRPARQLRPGRRGRNWPLLFLVVYIGFQVALLFLGNTPLRSGLRVGAYSASLALALVVWPGKTRHPAVHILPLVLICLLPGLFLPGQPSPVAAVAQATLYIATLSPLLWASHTPIDGKAFRRIILLLWAYNAASAAVGVLQVYFPGMFQGQVSAVVADQGGGTYLGSLTIVLANGTRVLRPMGLTDTPGGAANGGLYAILFGVGLLYTERRLVLRTLAVAGMTVGLCVIYLSHVRVTLVMAGIGVVVITAAFARRGDLRRASSLLVIVGMVAAVATGWAFAVGGEDTVNRISSLTEMAPADVYSANRGLFLQGTFDTLIFEYPFGAGLGRWGMINYYFVGANGLWAEIMWQAWIYDGGIPLMILYCVLIAVTLAVAWRISTDRRGVKALAVWGAVILAYDVAGLAATFDTPFFAEQAALEFWFLNACLFNAWWSARAAARTGGDALPGWRHVHRRSAVPPAVPAPAGTAP